MYKYMAKVVIKISKGSAVTQTTVGGLTTYIPQLPISCSVCVQKIMKIGWQQTKLWQKLAGLLCFWPTLYIIVNNDQRRRNWFVQNYISVVYLLKVKPSLLKTAIQKCIGIKVIMRVSPAVTYDIGLLTRSVELSSIR